MADANNYAKICEAIQAFCYLSLPTIQASIEAWHQQQTLPPCQTPNTCPSYKKPTNKSGACQSCIDWGNAIDAICYPPGRGIQWKNVTANLLHKDPVEVAKGFVFILPPGQTCKDFADFDVGGIMKMMMGFKGYHHSNQACLDKMKKVLDIRNGLSHMRVKDKMHVSDTQLGVYFNDIEDLVRCLQCHHPSLKAGDIRSCLNKIQHSNVTTQMMTQAMGPLTTGLEQSLKDALLKQTQDLEHFIASQTQHLKQTVEEGVVRGAEAVDARLRPVLQTIRDNISRLTPVQDGLFSYSANIKTKLSSYYKERYSILQFLPSEETYLTDDLFMEPEMEFTIGNENNDKLESCDELLSLKIGDDNYIRKHVVVVGNPGSGKTSVMHNRLAYDWAGGKKHSEISLLFVIDMCDVTPDSGLVDIIEKQLLNNEPKDKLKKLIENNAQSTAFLLDGFDEAPDHFKGDSNGLPAILKGTWLQSSRVVVTTRPYKLAKFNKNYKGYVSVNMIGFSDKTVQKFVTKMMGKNKQKSNVVTFQNVLLSYPSWSSWLLTNPLTLSMLCFLWKEYKVLPTGVTSLYSKVVKCLKAHKRNENDSDSDDSDSESQEDKLLEETLIYVGKYALENLYRKSKRKIGRPHKRLEYALRLGICSLHTCKTADFQSYNLVTFPLHKTFQEFFAAVYLVDLLKADQSKFLSVVKSIKNVDDMLRFCCGLSVNAALSILQHVGSAAMRKKLGSAKHESDKREGVSIIDRLSANNASDTCIFGVGLGVTNPWKLPLLLLYEAEIHLVDQECSTAEMHRHLDHLVNKVQMNCANWPGDTDIGHILEYFISHVNSQSWLCKVREVTMVFDSSIDLTHLKLVNQTRLVGSMVNLNDLYLTSVSKWFNNNCSPILKNISQASFKGCRALKTFHLSCCEVDVQVLVAFLSRQTALLSVTLDSVLGKTSDANAFLANKPGDDIDMSITSLEMLTVIDSKIKGHTMEQLLSALLSRVKSPHKLSLEWTFSPNTGECYSDGFQIYEGNTFRYQGQKGALARSSGFLEHTDELEQRHLRRQSFLSRSDFDTLSEFPLSCRYVTELSCTGCVVSLKLLSNLINSQPNLSSLTLQRVVLSGQLVGDSGCFKTIEKCTLMMANLCRNVLLVFLSLLPPFAHLKLDRVALLEGTKIQSYCGNVNTAWAFCKYREFAYIKLDLIELFLVRTTKGNVIPHCFTSEDSTTFYAIGPYCTELLDQSLGVLSILESVICLVCECIITSTASMSRLLQYLPSVTNFRGKQLELTSSMDEDILACKTMKICEMSGSMSTSTIRRLLGCMPLLTTVRIDMFELTGEVDEGLSSLCDSLTELQVNDSIRVNTLMRLLGCMPSVTTVMLDGAELTGEIDEGLSSLCESLKKFSLKGSHNACKLTVNTLVILLGCMPSVTTITLDDVRLNGDINQALSPLCKSLTEFSVKSSRFVCTLSANTMVRLLGCMPSVKTVRLEGNLTGEIEEGLSPLCESLKEFSLKGSHYACTLTANTLVRLLGCMPSVTIILLDEVELNGDINEDLSPLCKSLSEFTLKSSRFECTLTSNTMVRLLGYMPSVTTVKLDKVTLTGEIGEGLSSLCESLKEFSFKGSSSVCTLSINTLMRLLGCMPSVITVRLDEVKLTGEIDEGLSLCESLKEFQVKGSMSANTLMRLLGCMPSVTTVRLDEIEVTGEIDEGLSSLCELLKEFSWKGLGFVCTLSANTMMRLLGCMPSVTTVRFEGVQLTGEIGEGLSSFCESLKDFQMEGPMSANTLMRLLGCMPTVARVRLDWVYLTGEIEEGLSPLCESLKEFSLKGSHINACTLTANTLMRLLGCMPSVTTVQLDRVKLTGEINKGLSSLCESLMELQLSGSMSANTLLRLFGCMPSVTTVRLHEVELTGEIDEGLSPLCESLKEFHLSGSMSANTLLKCQKILNFVLNKRLKEI